MDISIKLPRFENEKALILLAGEQTAKFYLANNSRVKELAFFRVHPADYPDREGYRQQRGGLPSFGASSMDDRKDTWREQEFLTHLRDTVKVILDHEKPDTIYIFAPGNIIPKIRGFIPFLQRRKIRMMIPQNLVNTHPFRILEKITQETAKQHQSVPINPEARKILRDKEQKK